MSSLTKTRINKRLGPTNIVTKRMLPFVLSAVVGGGITLPEHCFGGLSSR